MKAPTVLEVDQLIVEGKPLRIQVGGDKPKSTTRKTQSARPLVVQLSKNDTPAISRSRSTGTRGKAVRRARKRSSKPLGKWLTPADLARGCEILGTMIAVPPAAVLGYAAGLSLALTKAFGRFLLNTGSRPARSSSRSKTTTRPRSRAPRQTARRARSSRTRRPTQAPRTPKRTRTVTIRVSSG